MEVNTHITLGLIYKLLNKRITSDNEEICGQKKERGDFMPAPLFLGRDWFVSVEGTPVRPGLGDRISLGRRGLRSCFESGAVAQ